MKDRKVFIILNSFNGTSLFVASISVCCLGWYVMLNSVCTKTLYFSCSVTLTKGASNYIKISTPNGQPSNPQPGQGYGTNGVFATDWLVPEIGSYGSGSTGPLFAQNSNTLSAMHFFGIGITEPGVYLVGYDLALETVDYNNWAHGWLKYPVFPTQTPPFLNFTSSVHLDISQGRRYAIFSDNTVNANGWQKQLSGSTLLQVVAADVDGKVWSANHDAGTWPTVVLEIYSGKLLWGDIWAKRVGCPAGKAFNAANATCIPCGYGYWSDGGICCTYG